VRTEKTSMGRTKDGPSWMETPCPYFPARTTSQLRMQQPW
jgi:hypothetical protein